MVKQPDAGKTGYLSSPRNIIYRSVHVFVLSLITKLRAACQSIIPFVPTENPTLDHLVYEMILAHFLSHDCQALLDTIKSWPIGIYDIPAVIVAVQAALERLPSSSDSNSNTPDATILMECLAEL